MISKIKNVMQIFGDGRIPERIAAEPISKVKKVSLDVQEIAQQAEFEAALLCAEMKHQRRLLEIVLSGKNYS